MKTNKMTSYAIRIVGRLHLSQSRVMTSIQISEEEEISCGAIMKILNKLKIAGIVYSKQGRGRASGGFGLDKKIEDITLYDIIAAMEGEITLYPSYEQELYKKDYQNIYGVLEKANENYIKELKRYSVEEILNGKKELIIKGA